MRNRWNLALLGAIGLLTFFSICFSWPGWPKKYLPDFIDYPEGPLLFDFVARDAMKLGLDVNGGSYVRAEADFSSLPPGTDTNDAMDGAKDIIENRVNEFGVSETEVTREGKNRLVIQLPGIPPEEASELIGKTAQLEFREPEIQEGKIICIADDGSEFPVERPSVQETVSDTGEKEARCTTVDGVTSGVVKWKPASGFVQDEQRVLTGALLKENGAQVVVGQTGAPVVSLAFKGEGGQLFQQITQRLVGFQLGIFLDDELVSAPNVNEAISTGEAVIEGVTLEEAKTLKIQLNAGALPVPLRTIQATEVDATLGELTLVRAVQAGLIGVLAVMAFMILYYRLPGLLASIALITYTSTVMALFKIFGFTITLAGIAGFVLSIGMAVDANVLVFERMKEELRAGRNLSSAIEHGFDRAWSSIRDSNVSTLITCGILYWFGNQLGASLVQGFALTLGLGVLVSMFSAIVVTRTLLRLLVGSPIARNMWLFAPDLSLAPMRGITRAAPFVFDFVRRRGLYFLVSAALLVPGLVSLAIPPALKAGIEFSSGATLTIDFADDAVAQDDLRRTLADLGHDEARVQKTSDGSFIVRLGELGGETGPPVGSAPPSERDELEQGIEQALGAFRTTNFNQVSEIVSREIARDAALAVGLAAFAILGYITWSFRNVPKSYRYGIAAIVAALHDGVFILGAFSIFGKLFGTEINSMFITGLLTVIGFSVHDTIVVFDRIRENVSANPNTPFDEVVNASLTETVARSINTSTTVVLTLVAMLLLGGGSIDVLLTTLLLGIIAGTYSSIFIASQILVAWEDGDFARAFAWLPRRRGALPAEAS